MAITLAEAEAELSLVNIAIENLLKNKTINDLKLGNAEFSRWYKFTTPTLDELMSYRRTLRDYIDSLTPGIIPVFRSNACIPLVVRKGGC